MKLFHRHKWEVKSKDTIPAPITYVKSFGVGTTIPHWMFIEKLIFTFQCSLCGAIKQTEFTRD